MIISRLEGEMLMVHLTIEGWFVFEKITDVDTPPSVKLVKKGAIKNHCSIITGSTPISTSIIAV